MGDKIENNSIVELNKKMKEEGHDLILKNGQEAGVNILRKIRNSSGALISDVENSTGFVTVN